MEALVAEGAHLHLDGAALDGKDSGELRHGVVPALEVEIDLDLAGALVAPMPDVNGVHRLLTTVGAPQSAPDPAAKGRGSVSSVARGRQGAVGGRGSWPASGALRGIIRGTK